jgi:hydroxymethylglutaryl-CoA synthase
MAVEAARAALAGSASLPDVLMFSTSQPAYLDKSNATAIHAALALETTTAAYDFAGGIRSSIGALLAALKAGDGARTLVAMADIRAGLPGGVDEREGGDGAAAFVVGDDPVTELIGQAHVSREFLDRWRTPGAMASGQWEERFTEHAYLPLASMVVTDVLKSVGLSPGELDHVAVVGPHHRANRRAATSVGAKPEAVRDLASQGGNTGAAAAGLALADILDRAGPGETVLLVSLADGADALVFRTTELLTGMQTEYQRVTRRDIAAQFAAGRDDLGYSTFLTWRGTLRREPPRRPDPPSPAAPPSLRSEDWKFGFVASRCKRCGTRHLPPARVCVGCGVVDDMSDERLADVQGTVVTFTIDRLAYTLSPPVVAAVIDFDGGGRFSCEMTDLDPGEVHIGLRVEMTFRKLYTADGIHNYFWKARPVRSSGDTRGAS